MKTMIAALAVCGLVVLAPLAQTATAWAFDPELDYSCPELEWRIQNSSWTALKDNIHLNETEAGRASLQEMKREHDVMVRIHEEQCERVPANMVCIIAGEHGGKTMGLGARMLEEDADSRIFVFVDQAAVEAAQSFVKELNKLDHEGDLPAKWELRCQ